MTHLFDSSASLAGAFGEPGVERVQALLSDPEARVGILRSHPVRDVHEGASAHGLRWSPARKAVADLRLIVEVVPLCEAIVDLAINLRHVATARVATVDCLIAATAAYHSATLVHRDPHFTSLPAGGPRRKGFRTKHESPCGGLG